MFTEQNKITDLMAKEGLKLGRFDDTTTFVIPRVFVQDQHDADIPRTLYVRKKQLNISYDASHSTMLSNPPSQDLMQA